MHRICENIYSLDANIEKGPIFFSLMPRKDEFNILCKCDIPTLTLGMMWSRKVDPGAEINGDNLVPQKY